MPFLTADSPTIGPFTGKESFVADTNAVSGANPSQVSIELYKLALLMTAMTNSLSKTMVSGTIYYSQFNIGDVTSFNPDSGLTARTQNNQSFAATGVNVAVGSTGGTDTFHVGVYNSTGVLVARSITAGVTAGTALTIQQIPLYQTDGSTVGPVTLASGTYLLSLQSNGNTAKFLSINYPTWPYVTGSQTGTAGTLPAITTVATTFTANLGPQLSIY